MQDFDYSYYIGCAYMISAAIFAGFSIFTVVKFIKKRSSLRKITDEKQQ